MKIRVNNFDLNILEKGESNNYPTLVFLHYFGGSAQSWNGVIGKLESDFHCVAPDLRGFGLSQTFAQSYALEDYAGDIIDLAQILKLKNYVLIGHSMGGKIALAVAAHEPAGLHSLILLAPSPPTPEPMPEDERQRLLTTHGTHEAAEETIKKGVVQNLPTDVFDEAIKANLQSSEAAWRAWLETGSYRSIAAQTKEITVPVLTLVGEKDENINAELLTREIIQRIPSARLTVIENAKHLLPLEAPEEVAQLIRQEIAHLQESVD